MYYIYLETFQAYFIDNRAIVQLPQHNYIILVHSIIELLLKIMHLELQPHSANVNELMVASVDQHIPS